MEVLALPAVWAMAALFDELPEKDWVEFRPEKSPLVMGMLGYFSGISTDGRVMTVDNFRGLRVLGEIHIIHSFPEIISRKKPSSSAYKAPSSSRMAFFL